MENVTFQKMNTAKKQAKLCTVIAERTNGVFDAETIGTIVTALDVSVQYKINVTSDPEVFAKSITMLDHHYENDQHTYRGTHGQKWVGEVLYGGEIEFGMHEKNETNSRGVFFETATGPEFSLFNKAVVLVDKRDWSNHDERDDHDTCTYSLEIYTPDGSLQVLDDETLEICKRFGLDTLNETGC